MGDNIDEGIEDIGAVENVENEDPRANGEAGGGADGANEELGLMIAESFLVRVAFGSMYYYELIERANQDPQSILRVSVNFEVIKYYHLSPEDDWGMMINRYAKINLDPKYEYTIDMHTIIHSDVYINGNGAVVMFEPGGYFEVKKKGLVPNIFGMTRAVFYNCKFVSHRLYAAIPFLIQREALFMNCTFSNFPDNTIVSHSTVHIRGCFFSGCETGVRGLNVNDYVSVSSSTFANCQVGATCKGKLKVVNCYFDTCKNAAIFISSGRFSGNIVTHPKLEHEEGQVTITCAEGKILPLQSVHIASNPKCLWPIFENNTFFRCRLYYGIRRGLMFAPMCHFRNTILFVEREVVSRIVFHQSFNQDLKVFKVLRLETTRTFQRKCECGLTHNVYPFLYGNITKSKLGPDYLNSMDNLDFTSDEEGMIS
ncbi:E1Bl [Bat mastadenovirus WIV17]|uniref:E1B 55 kDa protein n=1 Tax=Bat mastadenovirus WIV17 TaxID=1986505 RepID=A0A1X9RIQ8_9ADEN|nr:E1Bl [Bat mastadenovirus WIV17]ARQ79744.1 E1Bl [Bat mastadenovirus WIV17]